MAGLSLRLLLRLAQGLAGSSTQVPSPRQQGRNELLLLLAQALLLLLLGLLLPCGLGLQVQQLLREVWVRHQQCLCHTLQVIISDLTRQCRKHTVILLLLLLQCRQHA